MSTRLLLKGRASAKQEPAPAADAVTRRLEIREGRSLEQALEVAGSLPLVARRRESVVRGHTPAFIRSAGLQGLCVLRALREAATARATLMRWDDDRWRNDARVGEEHESGMVEAFARSRHLGA